MRFLKWFSSFREKKVAPEIGSTRVLVSTMDDCSLVGELLSYKTEGWVLGETYLEREGGKYTKLPAPGVVFVPAHRVTLIQELDDSFEMDVSEPAALQEVEGQHGKP